MSIAALVQRGQSQIYTFNELMQDLNSDFLQLSQPIQKHLNNRDLKLVLVRKYFRDQAIAKKQIAALREAYIYFLSHRGSIKSRLRKLESICPGLYKKIVDTYRNNIRLSQTEAWKNRAENEKYANLFYLDAIVLKQCKLAFLQSGYMQKIHLTLPVTESLNLKQTAKIFTKAIINMNRNTKSLKERIKTFEPIFPGFYESVKKEFKRLASTINSVRVRGNNTALDKHQQLSARAFNAVLLERTTLA